MRSRLRNSPAKHGAVSKFSRDTGLKGKKLGRIPDDTPCTRPTPGRFCFTVRETNRNSLDDSAIIVIEF